jgi:hypothetical protein
MPPIPDDQLTEQPTKYSDRHTATQRDSEPTPHAEGKQARPRGPPPPAPGARTLTVTGVTQHYGWSRSKTYELLGEGRLRGVKLGARLLIFTDSCDEVVAALPPAVIKPPRTSPASNDASGAR